jgi:hypothetical protein
MLSRHNFTAQTTRQTPLDHDENAVVHFSCCSVNWVEPKHLIPSSLVGKCNQAFGSTQEIGIASLEVP